MHCSHDMTDMCLQAGTIPWDDDEDEGDPHTNGCPCCIVRFLPMHRVCKDPTPAVAAMRSVRGGKVLDK